MVIARSTTQRSPKTADAPGASCSARPGRMSQPAPKRARGCDSRARTSRARRRAERSARRVTPKSAILTPPCRRRELAGPLCPRHGGASLSRLRVVGGLDGGGDELARDRDGDAGGGEVLE